mmetsp:Transcript_35286/g.45489  ORF Transcript_35286/g.45489 Transcript_35286/m.45489 type:complete len:428 (+) Transcript_35286:292-1575(+)
MVGGQTGSSSPTSTAKDTRRVLLERVLEWFGGAGGWAGCATEEEEEEEEEEDADGMDMEILEPDDGGVKRVVPKDELAEKLLKMKGPPPIKEIDASGNLFGSATLAVLGQSPMGYTSSGKSRFSVLTKLSLRKCGLTDDLMGKLANALHHERIVKKGSNNRRSYLDAEDVKQDDEPEGSRFPFLEFLDLSDHLASGSGFEKLCQTLEKVNTLKTLRIGRSKYVEVDIEADNSNDNEEIKLSAIDAVLHLLGKHHSLTEVDLYNLNLCDQGAEKLSEIIDTNATLETLYLESNNITGYGGEALLRALCSNIGIKTISLAHNPIGRGRGVGNGAVSEIVGLLQLNNSLESLDICDCDLNGFSPVGKGYDKYVEQLINLLRARTYSQSFKNLRLYDNVRLPKAILRALRDVAEPPLVIDFFPPNKHGDLG